VRESRSIDIEALEASIVDEISKFQGVAPTLSAFTGVEPPSGSQGKLLREVLGNTALSTGNN
jgi:hypothetical protein